MDAKDKEIAGLKEELALERKFPERFCMQETIRGQDKAIDRLREENKRLRAAVYECLDEAIREELEVKALCSFIRGTCRAALEGKDHDQA